MGYYRDYYRAEVRRVQRLTPNMTRVTFGEDDLARFVTSSDPDERLVVALPDGDQRHTRPPVPMPGGTLDYPAPAPPMRSYTVRRWCPERREMDLDFVAHERGLAAQWARSARPGDVVYLSPARGWYRPPADAGWQLLVADMTGLPALGRIAAELPAAGRALAIVEVIEPADRQPLDSVAELEVTWLSGSGHGLSPSALPQAVSSIALPSGPGYVWFAGEAGAARAVRRHLRSELGWPAERYTAIGYWRDQAEAWLARYERVGSALEALYDQALAEGRSESDALEVYDDALGRAGL